MAARLFSLRAFKPHTGLSHVRLVSTETPKAALNKATSALSGAASKATSQLSGISSKATKTINCASVIAQDAWKKTVYGSKVGFEVAKEVYVKENMAFPTAQQLEEAKKEALALANVETIKKMDKIQLYKAAYYGVQIYGFFLVGEIIGRFNLIGYNV